MAQRKTKSSTPAPPAPVSSGSKAKWIIAFVVVAAVVAILFAVSGPKGDLPTPGDIGNADLQTLVDTGARLVDVRTSAEFEGGHIPGAENVPVDQVAATLGSWDKSQPIVVYCATGSRSVPAMQTLVSAGFTSVYNLTAGIVAWDGELSSGPAGAVATAAEPSASGLPVLYEFYTDW